MTDIPANYFFGGVRKTARAPKSPVPADFPATLPPELTSRDIARLRALWPVLTPDERERFIEDLRQLAITRAAVAAREEAYQRRQQIQKNQNLINYLSHGHK